MHESFSVVDVGDHGTILREIQRASMAKYLLSAIASGEL